MWTVREKDDGHGYQVGTELPGDDFQPLYETAREFDAQKMVSFLNGGEPDPEGTREILEDICAALERIASALESK